VLMAAIGGCSFFTGTLFWAIGAWPVVGFLGLDVALVYLAFRLNYRSARAFEEIELSADRLSVHQVDPAGHDREYSFNPYWTRLEVDRSPEWGVTAIRLAAGSRRLAIGKFLNPDDRDSFSAAFAAALGRARRGAGPAT